jgi:[ribosomal protein S5]-alanine N-acetyltransferase
MSQAGRSPAFSGDGRGVPNADRQSAHHRKGLEIGTRIFLREPTTNDRDEIIARNRASRALHRGWVTPPTDAGGFARWMARSRRANVKTLLVRRFDDGTIVGVFVLSEIVRGLFRSAYLGYYVMQPFAGAGFMSEAMPLVLRHAFTSLKLHRVEANVQPENAASIALVKRSGFRLEGFSPRYLKVAGRWRDHQRWAILIDDWQLLRRRRRAPSRGPLRRSPRESSSRGRRRSG